MEDTALMEDQFADVMAANALFAQSYVDRKLAARAAKGLAVLTCMDSRIEPLAMLGIVPGDAKIMRNAGARVTEDALRSLVLATNLLGVDRICVVAHTDCAMSKTTDAELQARIGAATGADASGWAFHACHERCIRLSRPRNLPRSAAHAGRRPECSFPRRGLD